MKQKETLLNIPLNKNSNLSVVHDEDDDVHASSSVDTPLREDAFDLSDKDKMEIIEKHFKAIMNTLGLDLTDDSLKGTPGRVAKMFVKEVFSGLNPENKPSITLFENKYQYGQMLLEKNIKFYSHCEHHFVPIIGKAHVAYISTGKVIGLSKLNRIVEYYAKRPQVQERMTMQIGKEIQEVLQTNDVAVLIDAKHLCVSSRGVKDDSATTVTTFYSGKFKDEKIRDEFLRLIELKVEE